MRRSLMVAVAVCVAFALTGVARAEMVDNPEYTTWAKAKVGTKVTFQTSMNMGGMSMTQTLVKTLKSVAPEKVTVEETMVMDLGGMKQEQKTTREIMPKVDDANAYMPSDVKGTIKETGKETIKAGDGKEYECTVYEFTGDASTGSVKGKYWRNDTVPGGAVKTTMTVNSQGMGGEMSINLAKIETP